MKKISLLVLAAIFIFNGVFPNSFQSKTSFEHVSLTLELKILIDEDTSTVLFLFGIICVGGCPIGNYIQKVKNNTDVVYILPTGSTENDIFNFKRGLQVKGKIVVASQKMNEFVKMLSQKMTLEDYQHNFILELKNKKIENIEIH